MNTDPTTLTDAELADLIDERAERTQGIGGWDRYHNLRKAAALLRGKGLQAPGDRDSSPSRQDGPTEVPV